MIVEHYPMTVGGEDVRNEYGLLARIEDGPLMASAESVRYLILHCSATRADRDYTAEQLVKDHRRRGFRTGGYHLLHRHLLRRRARRGRPAGGHAYAAADGAAEGALRQTEASLSAGPYLRAPRPAGGAAQGLSVPGRGGRIWRVNELLSLF